jgi:hypothetical protein
MSWFSENILNPVENVATGLFHGDILGGQYQPSGSDWLKTGGVAAAAALPFLAGPALGFAGAGEAAGAIGGGELAAGGLAPEVASAYAFAPEAAGLTPAGTVASDFSALGLPNEILAGSSYGAGTLAGGTDVGALAFQGAGGSLDDIALASGASGIASGAGGAAPLSLAAPGAAAPWYAGIPGASWVAQNPLLAASLGVGGASLLSGGLNRMLSPTLPNQGQLTNIAGGLQQQAGQVGATGQQLTQPLLTGQLPPEAEAAVQAAMKDADATIRSQYARLGLTGSTPEADQIANLSLRTEAMRFQIAQQMAQSGTQLMQLASSDLGAEAGIYQQLMQTQIAEDNSTRQSFASLAGALALAGAIQGRGKA